MLFDKIASPLFDMVLLLLFQIVIENSQKNHKHYATQHDKLQGMETKHEIMEERPKGLEVRAITLTLTLTLTLKVKGIGSKGLEFERGSR